MRFGRQRLLALALPLIWLTLAFACRANANSLGSLTVDGRKRTYEIHGPACSPADRALPLVVVLHGRLGDGHSNVALTHFDPVADAHGFLIVYPDGLHRSWADGRQGTPSDKDGVDDVKFLSELIQKLVAESHADPRRVYVTGMSNGGFMTQRVACELAAQIAAAGSVAATMGENIAASCHPEKPVPMMFMQGSKDPLVPIQGGSLGGGGSRGEILSLDAAAQKWVTLNACSQRATRSTLPDMANDGTTIIRETFSGCREGADVIVYTIENGGRTWPGGKQYLPAAFIGRTTRNIDASEALWEFFSRHSR
jgi:polyhydroxybutyrate depolymerase